MLNELQAWKRVKKNFTNDIKVWTDRSGRYHGGLCCHIENLYLDYPKTISESTRDKMVNRLKATAKELHKSTDLSRRFIWPPVKGHASRFKWLDKTIKKLGKKKASPKKAALKK